MSMYAFRIEEYCAKHARENNQPQFRVFDNLSPVVNTVNCFDKLRVGPEHVSRQPSDTYYLNEDTVCFCACNRRCVRWYMCGKS